jgi:hypothetical protein
VSRSTSIERHETVAGRDGSGLSLQTLTISAIAAVASAVVVPLFWAKGTLVATAMTPVIVALISEALHRPARAIRTAAPHVVRRRASPEPEVRRFEPLDPVTPEGGVSREDPFGLRKARRRPRWKLGLITGLLAFAIAAAVVTASELTVFGGSVSGGRHAQTSLFGGTTPAVDRTRHHTAPAATPTPAAPAASATPTPSVTPTASPTVAPSATPPPAALPSPTP